MKKNRLELLQPTQPAGSQWENSRSVGNIEKSPSQRWHLKKSVTEQSSKQRSISSAKDYLGLDSPSSWRMTGDYLEYNTSVA